MPAALSQAASQPLSRSVAHGQTLQVRADQGDVIVIETGHAILEEAPCWLAETVFHPATTLRAGEIHVVTRAGWITLTAATALTWHLHPAAATAMRPGRSAVLRPLRRLLSSWWQRRTATPLFHSNE